MAVTTTPRDNVEVAARPRSLRSAGPCQYLAARPSAEDLARLAAGGNTVGVERHDRIFSEGDLLDAAYVIRRGTVALGRTVHGRKVTLLLLRDGDILGDIPMLLQAPASFDAVAETDAELVRIPAARLLATLNQSPEFARRWVLWLSGRLSSAHTRLLSLLAGDVRAQGRAGSASSTQPRFTDPTSTTSLAPSTASDGMSRSGWAGRCGRRCSPWR